MKNKLSEYMIVQEQLAKSQKDNAIEFPHLHAALVLYTKEIYNHKNEHSLEIEVNELYRFILKFFNK